METSNAVKAALIASIVALVGSITSATLSYLIAVKTNETTLTAVREQAKMQYDYRIKEIIENKKIISVQNAHIIYNDIGIRNSKLESLFGTLKGINIVEKDELLVGVELLTGDLEFGINYHFPVMPKRFDGLIASLPKYSLGGVSGYYTMNDSLRRKLRKIKRRYDKLEEYKQSLKEASVPGDNQLASDGGSDEITKEMMDLSVNIIKYEIESLREGIARQIYVGYLVLALLDAEVKSDKKSVKAMEAERNKWKDITDKLEKDNENL